MPDPVIRRLQCAATLYLEVADDGLSLARLVVDVPLPDPSVIVANLPSSFDLEVGDAWEGEDVGPGPAPSPGPTFLAVGGAPWSPRREVA
jgi:hypothetical protein